MSMNDTPRGERLHIGIFGKTNVGKSSIINALTNQKTAIVSEVRGTTTDPVYKAMELLPLGAVMIADTPGIDDVGTLGQMRVEASYAVLNSCDVVVLTADAKEGLTRCDRELLTEIKKKNIACVVAFNKCDTTDRRDGDGIYCSAMKNINIDALKNEIVEAASGEKAKKSLVGNLISEKDTVLLVIPIDESAPKGRLILPQQQLMRDVLDLNATLIAVRETKVSEAVEKYNPDLVVCDSQIFGKIKNDVPIDVPLTSFSILFARYKGDLDAYIEGIERLDTLKDGDKVLISEGCTHHRQCGDIGTVKLPAWIKKHTGKKLEFDFTQGRDFAKKIGEYSLVVHCGGCMLNEREMKYRIGVCREAKVPIVNYGMAIAHMNGMLERCMEPLKKEKRI